MSAIVPGEASPTLHRIDVSVSSRVVRRLMEGKNARILRLYSRIR